VKNVNEDSDDLGVEREKEKGFCPLPPAPRPLGEMFSDDRAFLLCWWWLWKWGWWWGDCFPSNDEQLELEVGENAPWLSSRGLVLNELPRERILDDRTSSFGTLACWEGVREGVRVVLGTSAGWSLFVTALLTLDSDRLRRLMLEPLNSCSGRPRSLLQSQGALYCVCLNLNLNLLFNSYYPIAI
jgi:hypothetical protein